jgi:hypothetical protein
MPRRLQVPHQIFNTFDEMALLVGLNRDPAERNVDFKERLADFWKNGPNSTKQGLVGALSSEFGLETYNTVDKSFFWLDHEPIVESGVYVYVDDVIQVPQLVTYETTPDGWPEIPDNPSLYSAASSGWILWQDSLGEYTQLLEFIEPPSGNYVTVDYWFEEGNQILLNT